MKSTQLDALDRQIAHALQVDGRAAFSTIAAALGVSDQTVARRYRRLRSDGALRVRGLLDTEQLGLVDWVIRVRCVPDAAAGLAAALARRPDTSWVSLTSGGTEIICFSRGRRPGDVQLLGKLPRTPRVVDVTAHCLLRTYFGGPSGWAARADALTAEQVTRLRTLPGVDSRDPAEPGPQLELEPGDQALLAELARDGRASHAELAAATGWSESTAARRLEWLRRSGALYFDVDIDPDAFGFPIEAMLWLSVPPDRLGDIGATLAGHAEIAFAAATTGPTNLVALVGCRRVRDLYTYLDERLGAIAGIQQIETAPVIQRVKRAA